MSTIAELMLKIGVDNSGLKSGLKDSKTSIKTAFDTNPVTGFTNALTGTTSGVETLIGKFSRLAAVAAGGFGFASLIDKAVKAGNATYELSQRMGVSSQDAGKLNRILSMSGSDVGIFNTAMMRLDKTFFAAGTSGEICRDTLTATGVALTDANGKMLPVTEQLTNMAQGYEKAKAAGQQQAFLMNTLGVKGLQLAKVFENYNEKMKIASDVKGVGLNPEEMHKLSLEMDAMKMQSSQLALVFGSALAPIAAEIFPPLLSGLQNVSSFLAKNKAEVVGVTEEALKLYAAYKLIGMGQSAISTVKNIAQGFTSNAGEKAAASELTAFQEKMITRSVKASEQGYMKKAAAAVKAAQTESTSADEAAIKIALAMEKITAEAEAASLAIRERMTAAFTGMATAAEKSAVVVNASIASTESAAVAAAGVTTTATMESAATCTAAIAESSAQQAAAIAATGTAAEKSAAVKTAATVESAETCTAVTAESAAKQAGSITAVGTAAEVTGAKQVAASESAVAAANNVVVSQKEVAAAEVLAGNEALTAGAKMESASAAATTKVGILAGAVNLLRQNWILVAYASWEALSWLIKYQREQGKIKGYNKNAEVYYDKDANGVGRYYKLEHSDEANIDELGNSHGGYIKVELSPEEYQRQYEEDEKNRQIESGEYSPPKFERPDLTLPNAGDYGKEVNAPKEKESAEQKAAEKARRKEIDDANKFAEQLIKTYNDMYVDEETNSKNAYQKQLDDMEKWHNDGLVSESDYTADLQKMSAIRSIQLINEAQKQTDLTRKYQKNADDLAQSLQDLNDANLTGSTAAAAAFQKEWDKALRDVKKQVEDIVSSLNNMKNPLERNQAIQAYQSKGMLKNGDYGGKAVTVEDLSLYASKANASINGQYTSGNKAFVNAYNQGRINDYKNMLNSEENLDKRYLASQQAYMDELKDLWTKAHHTIYDDYVTLSSEVDSGLESSLDKFMHGTASATDVFKNFVQSVIDGIIKIQAQALAAKITSSLLDSFLGISTASSVGKTGSTNMGDFKSTTERYAGGGLLTGPGTGTSDSILLWGSNKEYVISAGATEAIGIANLDYMNETGKIPGFATGGLVTRTPRFASGGLVTGPPLSDLSSNYSGSYSVNRQSSNAGKINIIVNNNSNAKVTATDGGIMEGIRQIIIEVAPDATLNKVASNSSYARNMNAALGR